MKNKTANILSSLVYSLCLIVAVSGFFYVSSMDYEDQKAAQEFCEDMVERGVYPEEQCN